MRSELYRRAQASPRRSLRVATSWLLGVLALYTCLVGLLSGYASYEEPFLVNNPGLYHWLRATLSLCNDTP